MQSRKVMKSFYGILFCIFLATSTKIDAHESWLPNPLICMLILDVVIVGGLIIANYMEMENSITDVQNNVIKNEDLLTNKVENQVKKICKTGDEFRNYDSTLSISQNIALELQAVRQDEVQNMSLQKDEYEAIDAETKDVLMNKKDMLHNIPKSLTMKGSMRSPAISLSGCLDVANIIALEKATMLGKGLIDNSFSKEVSFMHGDFIVTKSVFYGKTHIEQEASIICFDNCLLDELCIHKKDVIIELCDTVVTGDIIFDYSGIIVIDDKTVLGGIISNARVMMIKN